MNAERAGAGRAHLPDRRSPATLAGNSPGMSGPCAFLPLGRASDLYCARSSRRPAQEQSFRAVSIADTVRWRTKGLAASIDLVPDSIATPSVETMRRETIRFERDNKNQSRRQIERGCRCSSRAASPKSGALTSRGKSRRSDSGGTAASKKRAMRSSGAKGIARIMHARGRLSDGTRRALSGRAAWALISSSSDRRPTKGRIPRPTPARRATRRLVPRRRSPDGPRAPFSILRPSARRRLKESARREQRPREREHAPKKRDRGPIQREEGPDRARLLVARDLGERRTTSHQATADGQQRGRAHVRRRSFVSALSDNSGAPPRAVRPVCFRSRPLSGYASLTAPRSAPIIEKPRPDERSFLLVLFPSL